MSCSRTHYTLSLSTDRPLIDTCDFHMSAQQQGKYGDLFRYIGCSQNDTRQFGNLGLIGAKPNARLHIVNVDQNSVTVRMKKDANGNAHPLQQALAGIEAKLIAAYERDAHNQGGAVKPVMRPPQRVGHDHLVKMKRAYTVIDPMGEQVFEQSLEISRYVVCVQKVTYFNGKPFISLVLKSAKICPPSSPPRAVRETPQSLLDMMAQEASDGEEEKEEDENDTSTE